MDISSMYSVIHLQRQSDVSSVRRLPPKEQEIAKVPSRCGTCEWKKIPSCDWPNEI